jgi:serine/threonine protein kinase
MDYDVEGVLGVGGFGVVYRAREAHLQRTVAIKEYLPAAMATRDEHGRVILRSPDHANAFAMGLQSFINEARLLARFDHPSLVRVFRFWEDNGTAYMVMPCYEGQTLYAARKALDGPPDEAWLKALMEPLLGALDCLHREHVFHRDVAPDNILLIADADAPTGLRPVLLDFGAARRVITDHTQSLTAILKPSFAPIEQYAETSQLRQGPWTDLYALAAVLHYCITGRTPVPATARTVHDDLVPLSQMAQALAQDFGRSYSPALLATIDHGLAVRPDQRLASVAEWRLSLARTELPAQRTAEGQLPTTIALAPPPSASDGRGTQPTVTEPYVPTMLMSGSPVPARPARSDAGADADATLSPSAARALIWAGAVLGLSAIVAVSAWSLKRAARPAVELIAASAAASATSAATVVAAPQAASKVRREAKALTPSSKLDAPAAPASRVAAAGASSSASASREARAKTAKVAKERVVAEKRSEASAEAASPRQACGSKIFISLAICMKRQCEKPAFRSHAQCMKMRQQEEAQRQREQSL